MIVSLSYIYIYYPFNLSSKKNANARSIYYQHTYFLMMKRKVEVILEARYTLKLPY